MSGLGVFLIKSSLTVMDVCMSLHHHGRCGYLGKHQDENPSRDVWSSIHAPREREELPEQTYVRMFVSLIPEPICSSSLS